MISEPTCGLFVGRERIPLRGVRVEAQVSGRSSKVTVVQRYENVARHPVAAVYAFPLAAGSAVCGFHVRVGDRRIKGEVQESDRTPEAGGYAMLEGHATRLLGRAHPDIFTACVDNIQPGEDVEIEISCVALLENEGTSARLLIPTTISPRMASDHDDTKAQRDADQSPPAHWTSVPAGLQLSVQVSGRPLRAVDSPSHPVRARSHDGGTLIAFSQREAVLDRDFVLFIETDDANQPSATAAQDGDSHTVAMVTFRPDKDKLPAVYSEVIFLLDCSGSMKGNAIVEARRALALCIHALREGDTFNVICFGSRFTSMWERPRRFDQASLEIARTHLSALTASLDGTEILAPLKHLAAQPPDPKRPRQILLLTDGKVSNEDEIIEHCMQQTNTAPIFSFGIGSGASKSLVSGLAQASRGVADFIHPGERIEPKVLRMFNRLSAPVLANISVRWGARGVQQSPQTIPTVFVGDTLTVFGRFEHDAAGPETITVCAGTKQWQVPLQVHAAASGEAIPTLWARHRIRELEEDRRAHQGSRAQRARRHHPHQRAQVVQLAMQYGLMSKWTRYTANEVPFAGATAPQQVPIAMVRGCETGTQDCFMKSNPSHPSQGTPKPGSKTTDEAAPAENRPTAPKPHAASPAPALFYAGPSGQHGPLSLQEIARKIAASPSARHRVWTSDGAPPRDWKQVPELASQVRLPQLPSSRRRVPRTATASIVPTASITTQDTEILFAVLMTQRAEGSFPLSDPLLRWLGEKAAVVSAQARRSGERLIATTAVLLWLDLRAGNRREEWTRAAQKAQHWLNRQPNPPSAAILQASMARAQVRTRHTPLSRS